MNEWMVMNGNEWHLSGHTLVYSDTVRTLRSVDGDGNENVTKTIGSITKTTILHVITLFCKFFFTVTARLRRENAYNFTLYEGSTQAKTKFRPSL